ncbi:hypothetical protein EIKCOROL_02553 [Eikenella corrodens ATCC 23834]|uniref:Uncharacterized protein n=1 Tax=Eikenella corrodens ATCC 23834 TaxID=546274 RepID=C0DYT8_EIKCO|nr:hypothetical protein EIKCOROL_02553 [Eikenella corrodens ATCC 23834]
MNGSLEQGWKTIWPAVSIARNRRRAGRLPEKLSRLLSGSLYCSYTVAFPRF